MTNQESFRRRDGRFYNELREIKFISGVNPYAEGSCEVNFGNTKLLCTATIEENVPDWLKGKGEGWITAEYGMLPRATHTRTKREAASGKQGGRTMEIQRLIGRALRQAVSLRSLGEVTIRLDCDVLCADGGTRCAGISGAWVALILALQEACRKKIIPTVPAVVPLAAVSVGVVEGRTILDLCYEEDSSAEFDLNLVFLEDGSLVEIQGTAEKKTLQFKDILPLIELGRMGAENIIKLSKQAVHG